MGDLKNAKMKMKQYEGEELVRFYESTVVMDDGSFCNPVNEYRKVDGSWYVNYGPSPLIIKDGFAHHIFSKIIDIKVEGEFLITKIDGSQIKRNIHFGNTLNDTTRVVLNHFSKKLK